MPSLVGTSAVEAERLLLAAGFAQHAEHRKATTRLLVETVLVQDPPGSSSVPEGFGNISLTVSGVRPLNPDELDLDTLLRLRSQLVEVPDVHGMPIATAIQRLHDAGFATGAVRHQLTAQPSDTLVRTDPEAMAMVRKGTYVTLIVP